MIPKIYVIRKSEFVAKTQFLCQYINLRICYFSVIILSQISSNSSDVVFSIKIAGNPHKMFVNNWDITETNDWIWLLIFGDKSLFLFYQFVPKQLISLLSNICYIFRGRLWIIKKHDSQNHLSKMDNIYEYFKEWICTLAEPICRKNVCYISNKS